MKTEPKRQTTLPRALVLLVGLVVVLCAARLHAGPPSNRWLVIIEASRAMHARREATAQIAGDLVASGMNRQMRAGDTIGLWTFDDTLHSGEFSLQTWTPGDAKSVAERVALFVSARKYQGRADLDGVVPAMERVISNSEFITLILFTSGNDKLRGTPADDAVNEAFRNFREQQEKVGAPFVTVLRAERGSIRYCKVNTPPFPVELPPMPAELLVTNVPPPMKAELARVEPPPPPPPVEAPIAAPLIVHGKKPEPAPMVPTNPPPVAPPVITDKPVVHATNPPPPAPAVLRTQTASVPITAPVSTNETASAIASDAGPSSGKLWWIGGVLLGVGGAMTLFLLLRPRKKDHVSYITRSLDRDQK